jgi:hypothetical protein
MATTQGLDRTFMNTFAAYMFNGGAAPTQPATMFISLHTGDPGETGATANEVSTSGTAYARQQLNPTSGNWVIALTGGIYPITIKNIGVVTYAVATGAGFGTVVYAALWSAVTAGTFYGRGPVPSQVIATGNTASFAANAISISINGT